jgi:septum formation protein
MKMPLNGKEVHLILASASPRRLDLLKGIGLQFEVIPADIDEGLLGEESPGSHVLRLAKEKAGAVSRLYPGFWVLGADTVVVIDGRILGKPANRGEAVSMLTTLASRTHEVFTGYSIVNSSLSEKGRSNVVRSEVLIRRLSPEEIAGYIQTGEPMDKAGAYAIQGVGAAIVERVNGSYTNVVGLPLCEVARDLNDLGIFHLLSGD